MASGLYPAHQNNLSGPILALEVMRWGTELGTSSRQIALDISSPKAAKGSPLSSHPASCNLSCVHHMTKRQVLRMTENTS